MSGFKNKSPYHEGAVARINIHRVVLFDEIKAFTLAGRLSSREAGRDENPQTQNLDIQSVRLARIKFNKKTDDDSWLGFARFAFSYFALRADR